MTEIRRQDPALAPTPSKTRPTVEGRPAPPESAALPVTDRTHVTAELAGTKRHQELASQANRSAATAVQATRAYIGAALKGDEAASVKAQDQAADHLQRYQQAVAELKQQGVAYQAPALPPLDHEQAVREAMLAKFQSRLEAAQGSTLRLVGAELHNDLEAVGTGLLKGTQHLWERVAHFVQHPIGDAKAMFVDAASLLLHPIRNFAHALQAIDRFSDKSRYEQLMDIGDVLPRWILAPGIVPVLADAKQGIRRSEELASQRLQQRIDRDGADAPAGRTAIGTAVNRAVVGTGNGTVDRDHVVTSGVIDAVWSNHTDGQDDAISKVCELIRTEAKEEVCFQTYIFDSKSAAAKELLSTLAEKQRENPNFKVHILVDHPGIENELAKYGIKADVAAARPLISRRGAHTKMFVIDGKTGVIGGDNVDNPKEKDMLIKVRGPVVQAMLADFDSAWKDAAKHFNGTATPPAHVRDTSPPPPEAVPMTMLGKKGVLGFYAKEYQDNDADQGILAAFAAAQHEIKVMSPNLNADAVLDAIRRAAERGVKVKICIPLDYNKLGATIDAASNRAFLSFWAELPQSTRDNLELRNFSTNGREGEQNHTKFLAVDGQWAYVGSQNMDNQSFSFSRELGVGIDDPTQAQRLAAEVFDRDWATSLPVQPSWLDRLLPHAFFDH